MSLIAAVPAGRSLVVVGDTRATYPGRCGEQFFPDTKEKLYPTHDQDLLFTVTGMPQLHRLPKDYAYTLQAAQEIDAREPGWNGIAVVAKLVGSRPIGTPLTLKELGDLSQEFCRLPTWCAAPYSMRQAAAI